MEQLITQKTLNDFLGPKGFTLHHFTNDRRRYVYVGDLGTVVEGISVVCYDDNQFELICQVDFIFQLTSGRMSPLLEETPQYRQFDKMLARFVRVKARLCRSGRVKFTKVEGESDFDYIERCVRYGQLPQLDQLSNKGLEGHK